MRAYRRLWWVTVVGVSVPAAILSLVVSPVPVLVVTATALGLVGGLRLMDAGTTWGTWIDTVTVAVLMIDSVPVLGAAAVPLLMVGIATSTPIVSAAVPSIGAIPCSPAAEWCASDVDTDMEECLGAMTGAELCRAWSRSFAQAKGAPTPRERELQAGLRARLLDELERRDPDSFAAWLRRSPSPASEPTWVIRTPSGAEHPSPPARRASHQRPEPDSGPTGA
jgi:hypothetical protein